MRARKPLWGLPVAGAGVAGFGIDRHRTAEVKEDLKPAVNLPMTRVVMFTSGVGYFSRSGEVEGEARVDLAFQDPDVNDRLKSMVLEDFGNGHIAAVSYDSREPISRTLSYFAIKLNGNPTWPRKNPEPVSKSRRVVGVGAKVLVSWKMPPVAIRMIRTLRDGRLRREFGWLVSQVRAVILS
jgi:hypothetical protein